MKKSISQIIAFMAISGFVITASAADEVDQIQYPTITRQPVDDAIPVGSATTFSVQTTNGADGYQWTRNGVALEGQTNSTLVLENVGTNDVGYYSADVIKGSEVVPTRSASLNVYTTSTSSSMMLAGDTGGGTITVYGAPVVSSGSSGGCPGPYAGYVNFTKTVSQGWGWAPTTNTVHTATDGNRTDTKIVYGGKNGDPGCNQTSVTIPDPAPSTKYRFTIYFPVGSAVPTNSYSITLSGFDP
jgi:hypothetical protein